MKMRIQLVIEDDFGASNGDFERWYPRLQSVSAPARLAA
jgi:hypothetical protein